MSKFQRCSFGKQSNLEVLEMREDIAYKLGPDDPPECELCTLPEFQPNRLEAEAGIDFYSVECRGEDCAGAVSMVHLFVKVGDDHLIAIEEFRGGDCSVRGCGYANPCSLIANEEKAFESNRYTLPIKGIATTRLEEHHTSYEPEITITVCTQCHSKIHHQDGFHPELQPNMKRKEWETNG